MKVTPYLKSLDLHVASHQPQALVHRLYQSVCVSHVYTALLPGTPAALPIWLLLRSLLGFSQPGVSTSALNTHSTQLKLCLGKQSRSALDCSYLGWGLCSSSPRLVMSSVSQ